LKMPQQKNAQASLAIGMFCVCSCTDEEVDEIETLNSSEYVDDPGGSTMKDA